LISDLLHSNTLLSKQVQDQILFRVHSHFFIRESNYWKKELVPVRAHRDGVDEPLRKGGNRADCFEIKDVNPSDFARLLWVFYNVYVIGNCSRDIRSRNNSKYGDYSKAKYQDWIAILRLSDRWEFTGVKDLAIDHLERYSMDTIKKIRLYQDCNVHEKYLFPLYVKLASRDEFLGLEEARILGLETFVSLQQARERLRGQGSSTSPTHSPVRPNITHSDIVNVLAGIFKVSLADVTPLGKLLLHFLA
jgi:hypothetical protein